MPRDMSASTASQIIQGQHTGSDASLPPKRRHICATCERGFTTSGHLARHTRIHTGERNHKCPFPGCETRCSRQDNLQQHYRIHLSPGSRRSSRARQSTTKASSQALSDSTSPPPTSADRSLSPPPLSAPPPLTIARPSYHNHMRSPAPDSPPSLAYSNAPSYNSSRHTSLSPELSPYSSQSLPSPMLVPDHNHSTTTSGPSRNYTSAPTTQYHRMNGVASSYHEQPAVYSQMQLEPSAYSGGGGYHSHSHDATPLQANVMDASTSTRHGGGYYSHQQQMYHRGESESTSSSSPSTPTQDLYHPPPPHHHRQSYATSSELQHAGYSPAFATHTHRYQQQPSPPPVLPPIRRDHVHFEQQQQQQLSQSQYGGDSLESQWKSDGRKNIVGMLVR